MTLDPISLPPLMPIVHPPKIEANWALFLDLDGTLLDIAPSPQEIVVPLGVADTLRTVSQALGGALAVVSGRLLSDVDRTLTPLRLPGGGEHGAVVRMPDGVQDEVDVHVPDEWVETLAERAARMPNVLIERKTHSVVAHYRRAPEFGEELKALASQLVANDPASFETLEGKMALEIRARAVTKARAVDRLMTAAPFMGRVPVFVGDDVTDHDGFKAAERLGGIALSVPEHFAGHPSEVRRWLKCATG